jgi:hypothetical protein
MDSLWMERQLNGRQTRAAFEWQQLDPADGKIIGLYLQI